MSTPSKSPTDQTSCGRARHKWFPALVLAAAAAWWIRQATHAQYHTFNHFLVSLFCLALISLWYLRFGGGANRSRQMLVGGILLCVVAFFAIFRPVYNGDMGIFSWRLRFARDADERLAADRRGRPGRRLANDAARLSALSGQWLLGRGHRRRAGDGLGQPPAAGTVATRDRRRLVVVRHRRQLRGDAGTTRRERIGDVLSRRHRRTGVDPRRQGPLRSGRRGRAAWATSGRARRRRFTAIESSRKAAPASSIASMHAPATCCGRTTRPRSSARPWRCGARAARRSSSTTW